MPNGRNGKEKDGKKKESSNTTKKFAITIVVLVAVAFALVAVSFGHYSFSNQQTPFSPFAPTTTIALAPSLVTVSGNVTSSGQDTQPVLVTFKDAAGHDYTSSVSGGRYSVQLPNPGFYTVDAQWQGALPWQQGQVPISPALNLNQGPDGSPTSTYNIALTTPDSLITFSGSAQTQYHPTTSATALIFSTATGNQQFTVQLVNGAYVIQLPNQMQYSVTLEYTNQVGENLTCGAGGLSIFKAPGTGTSATANWSC